MAASPSTLTNSSALTALGIALTCQLKPKPIPRAEKRSWRPCRLRSSMVRANLKHLGEDAELRVQRGQRNIDRQVEVISALERDDRDTTMAKALLKIFEKAKEIPCRRSPNAHSACSVRCAISKS